MLPLDAVQHIPLTPLDRGLPNPPPGATIGTIADLGWSLGDLIPPFVALRRSALHHNLATMAAYCESNGVELAPHAKTTMAPQLMAMQLEHGAWGMTVSTAHQARVAAHFGFRRVLVAHQVSDRAGLQELGRLVAEHPQLDLHVIADSANVVGMLDETLTSLGVSRPVGVLVELGIPDRRTGVRTVDELVRLARAIEDAPSLRLSGVEGYEGVIRIDDSVAEMKAVDAYLDLMLEGFDALDRRGLLGPDPILSAGGSVWFDRVVERFSEAPPGTIRLLRSGCYVTHDHGRYHRLSPLDGRSASDTAPLRPALEVWAAVVSRPQPDLLIANAGRRDMSFDAGMPQVVEVRDQDRRDLLAEWWPADRLMDQHAMVPVEPGYEVGPGALVRFGISHPCTTFDKWRVIPVVDDDDRVTDAIVTFF